MYIDTHCHLNSKDYEGDIANIVEDLRDKDCKVIDIATDIETSQRSVQMSNQFSGVVFATCGYHPEEVAEMSQYEKLITNPNIENIIQDLKEILNSGIPVAIGECGLDYYWLKKTEVLSDSQVEEIIEMQKLLFKKQAKLATYYNLPLIIHTRALPGEEERVVDDCMQILKDTNFPEGVFHSYTGPWNIAKRFLELDYSISFNGIVTFKKANDMRELLLNTIQEYPKQFIFETDGPYLAPEGKRGKRNDPINVIDVYEFVSELVGNDVRERVNENVRRIFAGILT